MNKLIERLLATNFADLEGLQIAGTIPVKQEVLNEALAEVLSNGLPGGGSASGSAAPAATTAASAPLRLDVNALLKLVTRAQVTAHEGEIRLDFEIRR